MFILATRLAAKGLDERGDVSGVPKTVQIARNDVLGCAPLTRPRPVQPQLRAGAGAKFFLLFVRITRIDKPPATPGRPKAVERFRE